jgi:putative copper export protein
MYLEEEERKGKVVLVHVVKACMWIGGIGLLILNLSTRWR